MPPVVGTNNHSPKTTNLTSREFGRSKIKARQQPSQPKERRQALTPAEKTKQQKTPMNFSEMIALDTTVTHPALLESNPINPVRSSGNHTSKNLS
jgi:hypothetical protein